VVPAVAAAPSELVPPPPVGAPAAATASPEAPPSAAETGFVDLRSPIVGTFYRSASPEAAPFVEVGSRVRKGQVLCIVEAMKLMNEIESEIDAEVVEIRVANGQPVEYGEVLFRLRPVSA
jgi:acetyl-CoA carboxylase biotin carboxyl carrier protein